MTHQFKWRTIHALLSLRKVSDEDRGWVSFNVAPTQLIPVVRTDDNGERELVDLRWGLIPSWADDLKIGSRLINARGETVRIKPAFRSAFKQRRCIIPANGFYEWLREKNKRQPFHFRRRDNQPLLLAGLWESWTDRTTGEVVDSAAIITTAANADVQPIHDRMPAILEPTDALMWLATSTSPDHLQSMLQPARDSTLISHAVSTKVNNPRTSGNDASLVEPVRS
jgi:putative SOS response-associated peptidase YedK